LVTKLGVLQKELKKDVKDASWVRPENIHLTLKFLGEISEKEAATVATALKPIAQTHRPFTLKALGAGGFPNKFRPRLLCLSIEESAALTSLYENIETALSRIGIKKEPRPFRAHLTLCRFRLKRGARAQEAFTGGPGRDINMEFRVGSFEILKSVLKPGGALHSVIKTIRLNELPRSG
jgi:2'-5' RNA ligase